MQLLCLCDGIASRPCTWEWCVGCNAIHHEAEHHLAVLIEISGETYSKGMLRLSGNEYRLRVRHSAPTYAGDAIQLNALDQLFSPSFQIWQFEHHP